MKTKSLFQTTILLVLLTAGCTEKELPPPQPSNEPQFFISGQLNGDDFEFKAGLDSNLAASDYIDDTIANLRIWLFAISTNKFFNGSQMVVSVSHPIPQTGSLEDELKDLIQSDYEFDFVNVNQPPGELPEISLQLTRPFDDIYLSDAIFPQPDSAFFRSERVKDIQRKGRFYHMVECSFDCSMLGVFSMDTVRLTNGKAQLVFGGI